MATQIEINLREGTMEDLDTVTAKVHEFAPKMLRQVGANEDQIDEWLRFYADRNRWRKRLAGDSSAVVLAERGDILVGIGYVQTFRDLDYAIGARFGGLYIRYRGEGVGTAIMKERLKLAKLYKADYAQLECAENNDAMRHLAEKYGFEVHERYQHMVLDSLPFLRYRKALTELGEERVFSTDDE